MSTPQELVEAALARSTADGCIVVASEHTETNLRWAANALTTNGQMQTRSMTVVSTFERGGGTSAGVVTRGVSTVEEVEDLVRASERAGRDTEPADDAAPLVTPYDHDDDWDSPPPRRVSRCSRTLPRTSAGCCANGRTSTVVCTGSPSTR